MYPVELSAPSVAITKSLWVSVFNKDRNHLAEHTGNDAGQHCGPDEICEELRRQRKEHADYENLEKLAQKYQRRSNRLFTSDASKQTQSEHSVGHSNTQTTEHGRQTCPRTESDPGAERCHDDGCKLPEHDTNQFLTIHTVPNPLF